MERLSYPRVAEDEAPVEVAEAQENLDISVGLRAWPLRYGLHASRVYADTVLVDDKA